MNGIKTHWLFHAALLMGISPLALTPAVWADAWGASWGEIEAAVIANDPFSEVVYNTDPNLWYINAMADGRHSHVAPDFDMHYEIFGDVFPTDFDDHGHPPEVLDGTVWAREVISTDGGGVGSVWPGIRVATAAGSGAQPYIYANDGYDVYSMVSTIDGGSSDAEGRGEHDDLFRIDYTGSGDPPPLTPATVMLTGDLFLEGAADPPNERWWASWKTYIEVYDLVTLDVLGSAEQDLRIQGGPHWFVATDLNLEFEIDVPYGTDYALRFWLDLETHAHVPQPGSVLMLATGGLFTLGRRRF